MSLDHADRTTVLTSPASPPTPEMASRAGMKASGVRRALRHGVVEVLPPLVLFAALIAVWQIYVDTQNVRPTTLPSPSRVVEQGWRFHDTIWGHTKVTMKEVAIGFSFSVLFGTLVAIAIDFSGTVRRSLLPLLVASQTLPIVAIAPLMILWFGFGIEPKIYVVILVTFFPITVGWVEGFRGTEAEAMSLLRSMGANRWKVFRYVRFPSALPSFFLGFRIAITYSVVGAIFAEYVGAKKGLGIFMQTSKNSFRTDLVLAAVVVTAVVSITLFMLTFVAQRLLIPWWAASRKQLTAQPTSSSDGAPGILSQWWSSRTRTGE